MKELLKTARESKNIKTRELSKLLHIDQALISKFENGNRMPTAEQIAKLSEALDIDHETLLTAWLKEKILEQVASFSCGEKALIMALDDLKSQKTQTSAAPKNSIDGLIEGIELLKKKIQQQKGVERIQPTQNQELNFIHQLLQWQTHSFSPGDIKIYIDHRVQVQGKSLKEHMEVNNTREVLRYLQLLVNQGFDIHEGEVITWHQMLFRNLGHDQAGIYRTTPLYQPIIQVNNAEANQVNDLTQKLFKWYEDNKTKLTPLELASSLFLKFIWIQPFEESNEKMAVLLFSFILLKNGYGLPVLKKTPELIKNVEQTFETKDTTAFYTYLLQQLKIQMESDLENA